VVSANTVVSANIVVFADTATPTRWEVAEVVLRLRPNATRRVVKFCLSDYRITAV